MINFMSCINVVKLFSDKTIDFYSIGYFSSIEKSKAYLDTYIKANNLTPVHDDNDAEYTTYFDDDKKVTYYFSEQLLTLNPECKGIENVQTSKRD